jgi:hypothetical protein
VAGGAPLFSATTVHPESDTFWGRSRPPVTFKFKDGGGTFGGLRSLHLKQHGSGYALRAKGRNDALTTLAGGAVEATFVIGGRCHRASASCTKRGKSLRCS